MQNNYHYAEKEEEPYPSKKLPLVSLAARAVAFASIVVSMTILRTNKKDNVDYDYFYTYRYTFFAMVVGIGYTLLQIPFAIYYLMAKKRLIKHQASLKFDFFGDKVTSLLLATGLGAAFGATAEVKRGVERGGTSDYNSFFNIFYISAIFLLVGFLSVAVSSILSSLALSNKK